MYRRPDSLRPAVVGGARRHDQRPVAGRDASTPSLEERSSPRCGGRGKTSRLMQVLRHWRDHLPAMAGVARCHDQIHLSLVVTDATPSLEKRSSACCGGRGKTSRLKTPVAGRDAGTPPVERSSPYKSNVEPDNGRVWNHSVSFSSDLQPTQLPPLELHHQVQNQQTLRS